MAEHNKIGQWGEEVVYEHLVAEGYAIIERNWRMNHLEIDIIASKDCWIVFVEVKTRSHQGENLADIMTERKIARLSRAANGYITSHKTELKPRFDVAFVYGSRDAFRIEYIADAFFPKLRTYR